jgi:hypothetical protein
MGSKIDIESYLSKRDPGLGRAIRIVRAAKGPSGHPLHGYSFPGTRSGRHLPARIRIGRCDRLIAAGKDRGRQADTAPYAASDSRKHSEGRLGPVQGNLHRQYCPMFNANSKVAKKIPLTSDDELVEALTAIPGVGLWTVNVLLVCNFGRLDVAPSPDAAIHRITQIIYGLGTLPSADFVTGKTELWRPYRSIATMYLYQASKLKISAADIRGGRAQRDEASIRSGT